MYVCIHIYTYICEEIQTKEELFRQGLRETNATTVPLYASGKKSRPRRNESTRHPATCHMPVQLHCTWIICGSVLGMCQFSIEKLQLQDGDVIAEHSRPRFSIVTLACMSCSLSPSVLSNIFFFALKISSKVAPS